MKPMRAMFCFCVLFACPGRLEAQVVSQTTLDKTSYGPGENVQVSMQLTNQGSETVVLISDCNAPVFSVDQVDLMYQACVAYTHQFSFSPGSWLEFRWTLVANELGLPEANGTHRLVARFAHLADTLSFEAAAAQGFLVDVSFDVGVDPDTLSSLMTRLDATVLDHRDFGNGVIREHWQTMGHTVSEAVPIFRAHSSIRSFDPVRYLGEITQVGIAEEELPLEIGVTPAYPNPFANRTSFSVTVASPQRVQVAVYDLLGRSVGQLFAGVMVPGTEYPMSFQAKGLGVGSYIYRVAGESFQSTGHVTLIR